MRLRQFPVSAVEQFARRVRARLGMNPLPTSPVAAHDGHERQNRLSGVDLGQRADVLSSANATSVGRLVVGKRLSGRAG